MATPVERLDPWARNITIKSYSEQIAKWGLTAVDEPLLARIPDPDHTVRRNIMFAHRDFDTILECIEKKQPFVMMTGLMPSGKMHLGHKLIVDQMKWYQEHGAQLVIAISDVEAWVARGIPPSVATQTAISEYVTNFLAAGLKWRNGEMVVYSQWKRDSLLALAAALSKGATLGQMNAMYGFVSNLKVDEELTDAEARSKLAGLTSGDFASGLDWSVVSGKTFFPFIQAADILHPQLSVYGGPRPTVVPVGLDQDPHMRLARDLSDVIRTLRVRAAPEDKKVTLYLKSESQIKDLEKMLISDLGFESDRTDEEGKKVKLIHRAAGAPAVVVEQASASDIDSLYGHLSEKFPGIYISNRRFSVFAAQTEEGRKLLQNVRQVVADLGYVHTQIMPDGLVIYDANANQRKVDEALIRVESAAGLLTFYKPAVTYNRLAPGLGPGGKMSSSNPDSAIFLTDSPEDVERKLKNAPTGGKATAEEQRRTGGEPDNCPVYNVQVFSHPDDNFSTETYRACKAGELLCGDCKGNTIKAIKEQLAAHQTARQRVIESGELADFVANQPILKKGDPLMF